MNNKYDVLIKLINENIEHEKEMLKDIRESGGMNTCAAGMSLGAIDAYQNVLTLIEELQKEVVIID